MLNLSEAGEGVRFRARARCGGRPRPLRSVRPSLLDLRFTGDPWIEDHRDGTASLCLDDYLLVRIGVLYFDVPSFYQSLTRMRHSQARRQHARQA